jgi:hypothetical protein
MGQGGTLYLVGVSWLENFRRIRPYYQSIIQTTERELRVSQLHVTTQKLIVETAKALLDEVPECPAARLVNNEQSSRRC